MATLTATAITEAGLLQNVAVVAEAGGDKFLNTGKEILLASNAHISAARTITFDVPNTDNFGISGSALDRAVVVAAGETRMIGPFPKSKFNDANHFVNMTYSSEADLTLQLVSVQPVA